MGFRRLDDYPKLVKWYALRRETLPNGGDPVTAFLHQVCNALKEDDQRFVKRFADALATLVTHPRGAALCNDVEQALAEKGAVFTELTSEAAELALAHGQGEQYFDLLRTLGDRTSLATFRFLAAWVALNLNCLEDCIEQCELVEQPIAQVQTLHGQALLESGEAEEAIQVLEAAVHNSPDEVLAWFQLAKAYHVLERYAQAIDTVRRLRRIAPQSAEVSLMMAIVVLSSGANEPTLVLETWRAVSLFVKDLDGDATNLGYLFDLALRSGEEANMVWLIENISWDRARRAEGFTRFVTKALRALTPWPRSAQRFIESVSGMTTQSAS